MTRGARGSALDVGADRATSTTASWRVGRDDRVALLILLALPVLGFGVPALCGHPILTGDNLIQNLPLRALAGEDLRHGHLPLWNPYIWSGSPLLGGLNAGALYPFTVLFAFLPVLTAWTVNLVIVYATAATGMYCFLRQQSLHRFSAGFGAASFAFAGSMSAQVVHLGIVQGTSWIPWMLLIEQRLAHQVLDPRPAGTPRSPRAPSVARRLILLGLLGGLVLLTGEPRAMANAAVVVGLAALWHVVSRRAAWRARVAFVVSFVLAAATAAALGAIQLIPGWSFIAESQRAQSTVAFFGSGSLPPRWSLLMLVPDLMGGTGILHLPAYFSHYNLPEITGYVGILPLVAVAGLLVHSFGKGRDRRAPHWAVWFGLVVVGLALSYGTFTPLGSTLARVPFYGDLRLQSRNLVIVGLGLSVLLAYWLDVVIESTPAQVVRGAARAITVLPALAVAVVAVVALAWPSPLEQWLGVSAATATLGRSLTPALVATLVVALVAAVLAFGYRRLPRRRRLVVFGVVMVVDLLLFTVTSVTELNVELSTAELPTAASALPVAPGTRFAMVDPENDALPTLANLGMNDLNTLVHHPSVEGYGSLTANGYQTATGTRTHNTLSPCALARGAFVPLGLGTVLTLTNNLVHRTKEAPRAVGADTDAPCAGVAAPATGVRQWWFGRSMDVATALIVFPSVAPDPARLRVGLVSRSGATAWTPATVTRSGPDLDVVLDSATVGSGLVLGGPGTTDATDTTTVTTTVGRHFEMNGAMQSALRDASFHFVGYRQELAVFRTTATRRLVWIEGPRATSAVAAPVPTTVASARRLTTTTWGDETDAVTTRRATTLVRSEAYDAGWRVRVRDRNSGRTRSLPVLRLGLVEGVRLPAGSYTVAWTYHPDSVTAGLYGSLAGAVVVIAAGSSWWWSRRRRRIRDPETASTTSVRATATPPAVCASSREGTRA